MRRHVSSVKLFDSTTMGKVKRKGHERELSKAMRLVMHTTCVRNFAGDQGDSAWLILLLLLLLPAAASCCLQGLSCDCSC
jgi:hypothetical protein